MRFAIRNVTRIRQADFNLDGITVIAGVNNTAKSTVGKALFTYIESKIGAQRGVLRRQEMALYQHLWYTQFTNKDFDANAEALYDMAVKILQLAHESDMQQSSLTQILKAVIQLPTYQQFSPFVEDAEQLNSIITRLQNIISADKGYDVDSEYERAIKSVFPAGMRSQLPSIEDKPFVDIGNVDSSTRCVYIPGSVDMKAIINVALHGSDPIQQLPFYGDDLQARCESVINDLRQQGVDTSDKERHILALIDNIYQGKLLSLRSRAGLQEPFTPNPLPLYSASDGVLPIVALRALVSNHVLHENVCFILDEPEIHLHPSWQQAYARVLVECSRLLGVKILVITHSPYFFRALRVYSRITHIDQMMHTYQATSNQDGVVSFTLADDEDQWNMLYDLMITPFDEMEADLYDSEIK